MSETPNEKRQIDRSGLTINTDPDADAQRLSERNSVQEEQHGVKRLSAHGSDKPGKERGVRRVSR